MTKTYLMSSASARSYTLKLRLPNNLFRDINIPSFAINMQINLTDDEYAQLLSNFPKHFEDKLLTISLKAVKEKQLEKAFIDQSDKQEVEIQKELDKVDETVNTAIQKNDLNLEDIKVEVKATSKKDKK